jgi:hypothetical protein
MPGEQVVGIDGVDGKAQNGGGVGVRGTSDDGKSFGYLGGSDPTFDQPAGVYGQSPNQGVMGLATSNTGTGVYGGGTDKNLSGGIGVRGETGSGVGVQGQSFGVGLAGKFIGNVDITGNVQHGGNVGIAGSLNVTGDVQHSGNLGVTGIVTVQGDVQLANADCAEDFDIADGPIDPGTVVILDESGRLRRCCEEYDKRVAGVISGAGNLRPGIVLDKQTSGHPRMPVALFGKVFCKVDADHFPIAVGDALTTSAIPGHAMKVTNQGAAFGSVIGKALSRLDSGRGLIPMLVALQ